jgi:hypothetical protein
MKITAKQTPPEYQESPLFYSPHDFPSDVYVYGNPHFIERAEKLRTLEMNMESAYNDLCDIRDGCPRYGSWADALADWLPADDGHAWTPREQQTWETVLELYAKPAGRDVEATALLCALELVTGTKYARAQIRGCVQGDWQNVVYPADNGRAWFDAFEAEYFNTGTEWEITEDGDRDNAYVVYCTTHDPRAEIAEITGADPDSIQMLHFDGWTRSPRYREA